MGGRRAAGVIRSGHCLWPDPLMFSEQPLVIAVNGILLVMIGGIIVVGRITNLKRQSQKKRPSYVPGPISEGLYQQPSPAQQQKPAPTQAAASTKAASKKISSGKRKGPRP